MQRELTAADSTRWTCVQAFSGMGDNAAAREAAERVAGAEGMVAVVCTPSGGAQSVRLELPPEWSDAMSDDELLGAIDGAK
jgi:hypothetical protein